ncbi:T9SS type A sorting domain-containing protein [Hwangdonia lutea]|uniref:T9SS type A sorting domain-containing protein n=1 Tax=Hwangdonia lutea TaxID=3075823 RepID=A0AA97HQ82_9FLAO|nr:T9SS type A sorting domain-containing protein [Hwangdonia sp. SCSIO 19198]WOD43367.1 T9SS type A sorting domain-containing protein [Hwangdonia sp. SCSIO 19198]
MRNLYCFLATLVISFTIYAQQTYIPDDNFEQALIDLGYDNVLDNYVQTSTINGITYLDLRFKNISDLTGIEAFVGLTSLNCSFNDISTIDVSNNSSLNTLSCAFNKITTLDLSNNLSLNYLDCGFNNINSLDLSNNSGLTVLYSDYNNLTSLDIRNGGNSGMTDFDARYNPALECISVDNASYSASNWSKKDATASYSNDCDGGVPIDLTYVPDNNFEQALVDLGYDDVLDNYVATANISTVTSLDVANRNIADLTGIEAFSDLSVLNCSNNALTSLDLSGNTFLTWLRCSKNDLTSLDLSANPLLEYLHCALNAIASLDLTNNGLLDNFYGYYNNLTSLDIRNGGNSGMTDFDARYNPALECISVDNASYSASNWSKKDATASYSNDCDGGVPIDLTYVPDNNFEQALVDLGYDDVLDNYVATANISTVTSLDVANRNIADLTGIEAFSDLSVLNCSNNALTSLDLSGNTFLTWLRCSKNDLTSLDLSANPLLEYLHCALNAIASLDLTNNGLLDNFYGYYNNLTSLDIRNGGNSGMTDFDARYNPALECISVDNASYSASNWSKKDATASYSNDCDGGVPIDLTYVPDNNFEQALVDLGYDDVLDNYVATANISTVTSLDVANRNIADLTGIEAFSDLSVLNCSNNALTSLDLSGNTFLTWLRCSKNDLTSLDLSANPLLEYLHCALNAIAILDLTNNGLLDNFYGYYNNLTSLDIRNGGNSGMTDFDARYNPALECISVDNASYSASNWSKKDATASYSNDCNLAGRFSSSNKTAMVSEAALKTNKLVKNGFKIYPNPVNDFLKISLNKGSELIQVNFYNALTQRVLSVKNLSIDVSSLKNGIYFVEVETNKGKLMERIVVK